MYCIDFNVTFSIGQTQFRLNPRKKHHTLSTFDYMQNARIQMRNYTADPKNCGKKNRIHFCFNFLLNTKTDDIIETSHIIIITKTRIHTRGMIDDLIIDWILTTLTDHTQKWSDFNSIPHSEIIRLQISLTYRESSQSRNQTTHESHAYYYYSTNSVPEIQKYTRVLNSHTWMNEIVQQYIDNTIHRIISFHRDKTKSLLNVWTKLFWNLNNGKIPIPNTDLLLSHCLIKFIEIFARISLVQHHYHRHFDPHESQGPSSGLITIVTTRLTILVVAIGPSSIHPLAGGLHHRHHHRHHDPTWKISRTFFFKKNLAKISSTCIFPVLTGLSSFLIWIP
jgi:hypothetical protein